MATFLETLFGGNTGEEDANARDAKQGALDKVNSVDDLQLDDLALDDYEWLGDYSPAGKVAAPMVDIGRGVEYEGADARLADLATMDRSAFEDISIDPRLKDNQMGSLAALDELIQGGGMTAMDKANLARIQNETSTADRGRREAIKQNMAQRGMGGSGMDLLAQLQSNQAATDRSAQQGLDVAGMAAQRELDAIMRSGQLSGDMRGQEFGEQSTVAGARDAINKFNVANTNQNNQFNTGSINDMNQFNTGNTLKTNMFNESNKIQNKQFNADNMFKTSQINTGYTNDAGKSNWMGRQDNANLNTGVGNQEKTYNATEKPMQEWNALHKNTLTKANAQDAMSDYWTAMGDREAEEGANNQANTIKVGTSLVAASDERVKKDITHISPEEIDEFLQAVQPKKFKYKDPGSRGQVEGDRIGFLLQDVQDTKLGKKITKQSPDGTMEFDKDNLNGILLGALSNMAKGK